MKTLDKSRSFGTICGACSMPGAVYEQDGMMFDAQGKWLAGEPDEVVESDEKSHGDSQGDYKTVSPQQAAEEKARQLLRQGTEERRVREITGLHHSTVKRLAKS